MDSFILELLQEAPVSWKTIQKTFLSKYGESGLDNIAKSISFNNFQEFYQDVYKTLQKDIGGQKYEPTSTELIKIFKFLLEKPDLYVQYKEKLNYYGYYRYLNQEQIFNELLSIKNVLDFESFLRNLSNPLKGDLALDYGSYQKVYSDSDIDIYFIKEHAEIKPMCDGTTWCVKEKNWFQTYTQEHKSIFYIIVSKKEWYEQSKGFRKKYALRLPKIILDKENIDDIKKTLGDIINLYENQEAKSIFKNFEEKQAQKFVDFYLNKDRSASFEDYHLWVKFLNLARKLGVLEVTNDGLEYSFILDEPPLKFSFDHWRTYFIIQNLIKDIQELVGRLKSFDYESLFNNIDELINFFTERNNYTDDLSFIIPDFKDSFLSSENSEFTNNNQNVRILNFDQLPEPYHSQLKNFEPYNDYIEIKKQIKMVNKMNYDFINKSKPLIKEKAINIIKEKFKLLDRDYYEKMLNTLSKIVKTKFPIFRNIQSLDNYYFIKIEDDLRYFSKKYNDDKFGDPKYNFYFIYDNNKGQSFIAKTLSDDTLKEFEIRIKALLNDLGWSENNFNELIRLNQPVSTDNFQEMLKQMFNGLKNKALKINNIIKNKDLEPYTNYKFNFFVELFNIIRGNLGPESKTQVPDDPKLKMLLKSISKVDSNSKEYICSSLVKSLCLTAFFPIVSIDLDKFDNMFGGSIEDFLTDASAFELDEFIADPFYSALPSPRSLLFLSVSPSSYTSSSIFIGIHSMTFEADVKELVKTLSNVNFIVNFIKSLKLFGVLKILQNIFSRYIIFVNGEKDSVERGLSNLVAQIIGEPLFGHLLIKSEVTTITFNDVIETTEEIEKLTSLLLFYEKKNQT